MKERVSLSGCIQEQPKQMPLGTPGSNPRPSALEETDPIGQPGVRLRAHPDREEQGGEGFCGRLRCWS